MWKEYSKSYIQNNRLSGLSVRIAAFISALLLSLLCGVFYNLWKYEVERIVLEEGGWQSRIAGSFSPEEIEAVRNFASVKDMVVRDGTGEGAASYGKQSYVEQGDGQESETVIDLYFDRYGAVLKDTPRIAELAGASPEQTAYHYGLLAMYLIRHPSDPAPRLLFPLFLLITGIASFSLIVIIHNSFVLSMNARIHQFGIFSSIGATPRQIRTCLLQEAAVLCAFPVVAGNLSGIAGSMGILELTNRILGGEVPGRHKAVFGYHPLVLGVTLFVTVLTIWISAWLPAGKLSRLTPLEAIKNTGELQLKRRKNSRILGLFFGMEGELAGNALKAQRKALRTASLSLVFSFMAFTMMECFVTTSDISTRETYFERYQDVWDIMVTVRDGDGAAFEEINEIRALPGVESVVAYQKAMAKRVIREEEISEEMKSFGGFSHASESVVTKVDGGWMVNAPLVILDDSSFLDYCEQIGIPPCLDGAVVRNLIRDVTDPDFRHVQNVPYLNTGSTGEGTVSILMRPGSEEMAEVPVLCYTAEVPLLREEYATLDYYQLVHFLPVSLWEKIRGQIGEGEGELYLRILGGENVTLEQLNGLQERIDSLLAGKYVTESENRIQEYELNGRQIQGMKLIFGGFCVLLALIGIGNVFSNTLGFVRQRKREFARYMSLGLTPENMGKMFRIEAMVLAGRPVLVTLPLAVVVMGLMLKMSYIAVGEFLAQAPFVPIAVFMAAILGFVALAYYLGWRNVRKISLAEVLRDDTML
ncbi:MAG TPA: ABC transporter permease [Lachnospiraceae bacterium]|nr:ABC transporter permease [Lachnospiraceae bacterium]